MIADLDPFVVLQYISSSIDVIINLKFEDIENKMIQKTQNNDEEDLLNKVEVTSLNPSDRKRKNYDKFNKKDESGMEDTPQQIREKVNKNDKLDKIESLS